MKLTVRENFLRAFRCEETERMPFCFVIDNFNYPDSIPDDVMEPFRKSFDLVGIQRYLGADILNRLAPSPAVRKNKLLKYSMTELEDGTQLQEWEMPEGKISGTYRKSTEAGGAFLDRHGITDPKGYEILMSIIEDTEILLDPSGVEGTRQKLIELGDDGVLYNYGTSTPIMDLARVWVGLERFVYDLYDYPDLVEKTMDVMAKKIYEEYEMIAANTPAELIVYWDDVNTLYISEDMFKKYALPVHRNIADICHKYGKRLVCHTCGSIKGFLKLFLDTGIDAIDWVTPPDTGDVVFSEAQELFKGKICIMGTVIPTVMRFGTPDMVEQHVHEILKGVDTRNGFIFMVPAPVGSPMKNVERLKEVVTGYYF